MPLDSVTFNKATLTLPEGELLAGVQTDVRFLSRRSEVYILDRMGRRLWTGEAVEVTKRGRNRATVVLASGARIEVENDCGCGGARQNG